MKILAALLLATVMLAAQRQSQTPPTPQPRPMTYGDRAAVEINTRAYVDAWLANDAERVMATLLPDATILPSGLRPITGAAAIRQFWFPAKGPVTRVTAMNLSLDDIRIDGDLAVVSGLGTLTFVTMTNGKAGPSRTLASWYVNILRRQPNDRWLIWRRAWSDLRQ
jgi:uncharacterized protein (TIGR02246 family)